MCRLHIHRSFLQFPGLNIIFLTLKSQDGIFLSKKKILNYNFWVRYDWHYDKNHKTFYFLQIGEVKRKLWAFLISRGRVHRSPSAKKIFFKHVKI